MLGLSLLDRVLSSEADAERTAMVAAELIQSALGELGHLEKFDESLAPSDPREFDRQTIAILRGMYEEWARSAEALLERIAQLERRRGPVPGSDALRDAHGRTGAMLSIPLDQLERGHRDAVAGRTTPIREVRRELRLGTG